MTRISRREFIASVPALAGAVALPGNPPPSGAAPRPAPLQPTASAQEGRMEFIYFTKYWPNHSVENLIQLARRLGADGLDLAVRKGHAVNPENARATLSPAMKRVREAGLSILLVSTETSLSDPAHPTVEPILAACGEAGVPFVKIGYFNWRAGEDYGERLDDGRRKLEAFGRLAEKHGVTVCYHTHSGGHLGSNASGLMRLLDGADPRRIGAYVDRGHMAANGESWPMGLAMAGAYLKVIGGKDIGWYREPTGGGAKWTRRFVPFREGLVDWTATFRDLRAAGFDGPVTMHGEYDLPMTPEQHVEMFADDIAVARAAHEAARG